MLDEAAAGYRAMDQREATCRSPENSIDTQKGSADWFTGDVYIDAVAAPATCDDTVTKTLQRTRCRLVQRLS